MLDVENVKMIKIILQSEVDKAEKAKAKLKKYRDIVNKSLEEFYKKRYNMYCFRFDGMCDMLYDLGYNAFVNGFDEVVVKDRDDVNNLLVDEIPF